MKTLLFFLAVFASTSAASYAQHVDTGFIKKISFARLSGNADVTIESNPTSFGEITVRLAHIPETEATIIVTDMLGGVVQQFTTPNRTVTFLPDYPANDVCVIEIRSDGKATAFSVEKIDTSVP